MKDRFVFSKAAGNQDSNMSLSTEKEIILVSYF